MATVHSLFFGVLFTALCSVKGDRSGVLKPDVATPSYVMSTVVETSTDVAGLNYNRFLCRSVAAAGPVPFLLTEKKPKGQGLVAHPKFNLCSLKIKNSPDLSGSNSLIFLTRPPFKFLTDSQPRPIYSVIASSFLQLLHLSPLKFLIIAGGSSPFVSKVFSDEFSFAEHFVVLRNFCGKKYEPCHGLSGIEAKHSGDEDNNKIRNNKTLLTESRQSIIAIASAELGIKEATGNNDGPRVEKYLAYTGLTKGYDWCAAFVSWVYGQAGLLQPRNPWSPALFPKAKSYKSTDKIQQADLFGIYSSRLKRIHHVGLIKEKQGQYILTIEGNSNDRVESRRRHQRTVYSYADWMD